MSDKQKKQLLTLSLAGAVLLAGVVAGFLVLQNQQQVIQNRAAAPAISCTPLLGTCSVPGGDYSPYIITVKEVAGDGSQKIIATSAQNARTITFNAKPLTKYICEVVATGDASCKTSIDTVSPDCRTPQPGDPTATATPIVTIPLPNLSASPTMTPTSTPKVTITRTATNLILTATVTPTKTPTPTGIPVGGSGITSTVSPSVTPTSTATTSTITAAATGSSQTSTTSLPTSGVVHPAIILGVLSMFIILLGLAL